jgi:SAM-dependent methyltransferase
MDNSIAANLRVWSQTHAWAADGDEWTELADYCGQPYGVWKDSVVQTWLVPFITPDSTVLEIAPGHGRWTEAICRLAGPVILVDVSQSCIQHCQRKFSRRPKMTYLVNDGQDLSGVADNSVDFAFSFDAFVHMDVGTITAYLAELSRVLVGGGRAVIHHPGRAHVMLPLRRVRVRGGRLGRLYARLSLRRRSGRDGWRSDVSRRLLARIAQACGLRVLLQTQRWGEDGSFDVRRYNDWITVLASPPPAAPGHRRG